MKTSEAYSLISKLREKGHAVFMLCSLFRVSQSGYFSSLNRPLSKRTHRRIDLSAKVIGIFKEHKGRYGRPRIYREMQNRGEDVSEKFVGSVLRQEGLQTRKKRPFRPCTTQSTKRSRWAPNLLKEKPPTHAANEVLVSDITYVATREGWLYLAAVMDLYTKTIKGYRLASEMPTSLVSGALDQAMTSYPKLHGAIIHSDRGCQYTSDAYLEKVAYYGLKVSMSAKGNCYDNAAMESFWSTLKTECFPSSSVFESREEARQSIFEYIEGYYHTCRMHSSLHYLTPLAAEKAA